VTKRRFKGNSINYLLKQLKNAYVKIFAFLDNL
jgi:hypothetical protein